MIILYINCMFIIINDTFVFTFGSYVSWYTITQPGKLVFWHNPGCNRLRITSSPISKKRIFHVECSSVLTSIVIGHVFRIEKEKNYLFTFRIKIFFFFGRYPWHCLKHYISKYLPCSLRPKHVISHIQFCRNSRPSHFLYINDLHYQNKFVEFH